MNRVIELVPGVLAVGAGAPALAHGVGIPSLVVGDVGAALLGFPRYTSEAAALSGAPAPAVGVVWAGSEWLPLDATRGYCARVPRIPPSTAAKRKVVVWLMALRSSRA